MKKRGLLLTTLLAVLLLLPQTLQAAAPVKLWIHGKDVVSDVSPFIENNRTLVPLRVITENLGYEVTWDGAARKVSVNKDDLSATLTIGSGEVAVNKDGKEKTITIEVPATIKNNRTFVPLRAIGELFGEDVDWDKDNRTAIVGKGYTPKAQKPQEQPQPQKPSTATITTESKTVAGVRLNIVTVPNDANLKFDVIKGNNRLVGSEPFMSMVKRSGATVAVNGNFFDAYRSLVPYGNIIKKGQIIQGIGNDGAFIRTASGKNVVSQPNVFNEIKTPSTTLGAWYTNAGLNDNTAIGVFNPFYGTSVKLPGGMYAAVSNNKVTAVAPAKGAVTIPSDGYIVYFAKNGAKPADVTRWFKVGDTVSQKAVLKNDPRLEGETVDVLVAAGPMLVKEGKNVAASSASNYEGKIKNQNAQRSAIGVKADGSIVIVTGKATVVKMANALIALGCIEATNLDGGASSALYANGRVMTSPGRKLNTVLTIGK